VKTPAAFVMHGDSLDSWCNPDALHLVLLSFFYFDGRLGTYFVYLFCSFPPPISVHPFKRTSFEGCRVSEGKASETSRPSLTIYFG
jgi:hypothetical protein